jgi:Holliday junction resolvase RusA-like endonuclease
MLKFKLHGNPVPAARPKVSRFGTYYPKTYRAFRTAMELVVRKMFAGREPMVGPLQVVLDIFVKKPKTSKLVYPIGDCDNYAKAYLDSLNGYAWVDDRQIVHLTVTKDFTDEPDGYASVSIKQVDIKASMSKVSAKRTRRKR